MDSRSNLPDEGAWDRVRAELRNVLIEAKRFEEVARKKRVVLKDQRGIVTVTVDGFGDIIDLAISDQAVRYPQQLGDQVTEAVAKARRAGQAVGERLRELHFPDVPSASAVKSALFEIPDAIHYDQIDYIDSQKVKNIIAECGEFLRKLANDANEFERKSLRHEIGAGAGYVQINLADSIVKVKIRADAPKNIGLMKLAQQILTAIKMSSEQAGRARINTFKKALAGSPVQESWRAFGERR